VESQTRALETPRSVASSWIRVNAQHLLNPVRFGNGPFRLYPTPDRPATVDRDEEATLESMRARGLSAEAQTRFRGKKEETVYFGFVIKTVTAGSPENPTFSIFVTDSEGKHLTKVMFYAVASEPDPRHLADEDWNGAPGTGEG
jgi:hypothetical protein